MYAFMVDVMEHIEANRRIECDYLQRTEWFIQLAQHADKYEPHAQFDESLLFMASTQIGKYHAILAYCPSIVPICLDREIVQSKGIGWEIP